MSRRREYLTNAERQAAYRQRRTAAVLAQIPTVQGEGYTLYLGDALTLVPALTYDHCLTDPPYEAQAHTATRRTRAFLEGRTPYAAIPFAPITEAQRRFFRSLRCGWVVVFCQAEAVGLYQRVFGACYKRPAFWDKPDGAPQFSGARPAMGYESLVCAWMRGGSPHWNGGGKRGVYRHLIRDGAARVHATQKPVPLLAELLRDFTQPGDVILDPFMGSGSTGLACLQEGRRFVGIEVDPATYAVACTRITAAERQGVLFVPPVMAQQAALFG